MKSQLHPQFLSCFVWSTIHSMSINTCANKSEAKAKKNTQTKNMIPNLSQEAITSRLAVPADDDNMEIVVVSDTVRQRRSRTPSSTSLPHTENVITDTKANVMPDLLPKTFHLAESSSLFSQIDNAPNVLAQKSSDESDAAKFSVVEIRESNISPLKRVVNTYKRSENVEQISNTCSILEAVSYLEPSRVETVHIIDATSEPSDSETTCSTPNLDDRDVDKMFSDDDESGEYETGERGMGSIEPMMRVTTARISFKENKARMQKDRDLLRDSDEIDVKCKIPPKPQRKKLTPTLKEILSAASDRDSFYSADKEVFDEPLTFSDDDDHHIDGQLIDKFNRHTVYIKTLEKQKKMNSKFQNKNYCLRCVLCESNNERA